MPIDPNYYDWFMTGPNNVWAQEGDGVIYTAEKKFDFDDLLEYTKNPTDDLRKHISECICIEDIANSLSKISRFGGHCNGTWSVAEHSVFVARIVESLLIYEDHYGKSFYENTILFGLLHDAAEAYLGDMVSPLKRLFPQFKQMDKALTEIIIEKYTSPSFFADKDQYNEALKIVKYADMMAYFIEHNNLLSNKPNDPVRNLFKEERQNQLLSSDKFSTRFITDTNGFVSRFEKILNAKFDNKGIKNFFLDEFFSLAKKV